MLTNHSLLTLPARVMGLDHSVCVRAGKQNKTMSYKLGRAGEVGDHIKQPVN